MNVFQEVFLTIYNLIYEVIEYISSNTSLLGSKIEVVASVVSYLIYLLIMYFGLIYPFVGGLRHGKKKKKTS